VEFVLWLYAPKFLQHLDSASPSIYCHFNNPSPSIFCYLRHLTGTTTLSIMTLSIPTLSIKGLFTTLAIKDTQHYKTLLSCWVSLFWVLLCIWYVLSIVMLSVVARHAWVRWKFTDCLTSKISFDDHLTCKIQSLNDIYKIKQTLNNILCV